MSDEIDQQRQAGEATAIATLHSLRIQRGVVKRSVTRLVKNLKKLEDNSDAPGVVEDAKRLVTRLETFDKDFRSVHGQIANLFEEDLEKEHEALDNHEDNIASAFLRLQRLISNSHTETSNTEKVLTRKLSRVERRLRETEETLAGVTEDDDEVLPLLEQHKERLDDVKRELSAIYEELIRPAR